MANFPYVLDYSLFTRVEISCAEELLNEYNDFYIYNLTQVQNMCLAEDLFNNNDESSNPVEQGESEALNRQKAEHNSLVAADHFASLFGSKDFAESTLIGLKINYYDIQQILLEEYKAKVPILESAINTIAPKLRNIASALIFAERVIFGLEKLITEIAGLDETAQNKARKHNEKIELALEFAKDGFNLLLERLQSQDIQLPEYSKLKSQFRKMKTADAYIDICEQLFFVRS